MSRFPPGRERQADHMKRAHNRGRPHPKPQQQAKSNGEFHGSDQITEKYGVRQNQVAEDRLIRSHRAALRIALQILLETAVGKFRAEQFVLAEQEKETGCCHAHNRQSLGKKRWIVSHELPIMPRTAAPHFSRGETVQQNTSEGRLLSAGSVVQDILLQRIQFAA